jgi:L-alanine-DL-glutamate epimerase-like enolase superfamily enzyme
MQDTDRAPTDPAPATPRAPAWRDDLEVLAVDCALLRVPLGRPIAGASARPGITPKPFTSWDVISVTVRTKGGLTGWGLTYELRAGGEAVLAALRHDLVPLVIGADCRASERLWHRLYWATYNAGRRGAFMHALSALDIAFWDVKAKAAGVPLAQFLGADRRSVPVYESDHGWLNLPTEELVRLNAASVERGMRGVKISVGLPGKDTDERRLAAVRQAIGPDPALMVDAGQKWDFRTALERIRRLEQADLYWVEEPLSCDDVEGHARLAERIETRIATGQTVTTRYEIQPLLDRRAVDVVQVDAARIGGVSEWWRIAHLAEAAGATLAPHFLAELHVSLVAASPVGAWVENTPWLSAILADPPALRDGELVVPDAPGHGLSLVLDADKWRIA